MKRVFWICLLSLGISCGGEEAPANGVEATAEAATATEAPLPTPEPIEVPSIDRAMDLVNELGGAMPATATPTGTDDSSGGCDELRAYEGYVNDYIRAVAAMNRGDYAAAAQLATYQANAQRVGEELSRLEPGTDCYRQFIGLQMKMTEAAMTLGGGSTPRTPDPDLRDAQRQLEKANDALGCMKKCESILNPMSKISCLQGCQ